MIIGNEIPKITDPNEILEACRKCFNQKKKPFLHSMYIKSENLIIEGAGILSINKGENTTRITLTNSDSNYTMPTGQVELKDIGYVQEYLY